MYLSFWIIFQVQMPDLLILDEPLAGLGMNFFNNYFPRRVASLALPTVASDSGLIFRIQFNIFVS